ncbi:restriction endonuclease subunit S [soil metagenome]
MPEGWMWARLDDVGYELGQKVPDRQFTYVDVSSIDNRLGAVSDQVQILNPQDAPSRARKLVSPGTVVYSTVRPYLLNIAVIDRDFDPEPIVSTAFAVLHPLAGIEARYLFHYLRSAPFIEYVEAQMTGMAYPAINDGKFYSGPVPVPPLAEQHRIVAKVDQLMALCDELEKRHQRRAEARVRLNRASLHHLTAVTDDADLAEHWRRIRDNFHRLYDAPETVTELRQAVLQLAVRGKLVPQDPSDEPASVLLERIEAERERLYKEGRIGQPKDLPPIEFGEVPFEVPDSWEWVRFGELQEFTNGFAFQSGDYQPDGIGIIRIGNLANGAVDTTNMKRVPARLLRELDPKLQVRKGDLLIGMSGSIGKVAFSTSDETFLLNQRVGRIAPILMDKFYIYYFLRTTEQQYLEISFGSAIKNLSTEQIRTTAFPLPPLVEQRRIVEKVDQLMALCDELEAKLTRSRTKAEKLASAVVHHLTAA